MGGEPAAGQIHHRDVVAGRVHHPQLPTIRRDDRVEREPHAGRVQRAQIDLMSHHVLLRRQVNERHQRKDRGIEGQRAVGGVGAGVGDVGGAAVRREDDGLDEVAVGPQLEIGEWRMEIGDLS